jgi:hypothetical protein
LSCGPWGGSEYYVTKNIFLEVGYRPLNTDFSHGGGRSHVEYNTMMQGPYLAVGVDF